MELTELISELCKEAVQYTPDVFDKVIKAAKSEGLLRSSNLNLTRSRSAQRDADNAEERSGVVPAVKKV